MKLPPILQIGEVLISSDILTEAFCCDLAACRGACCVEGDAGAPVTLEEVEEIERLVDDLWPSLSAQAQSVVERQGVAYVDREGDLVTSIVGGKDCVFTCHTDLTIDGHCVHDCCLCLLEKLHRDKSESKTNPISPLSPLTSPFVKPISCALYPIREKTFSDGTVALNYHQWDVCRPAREKGRALQMPVYRFLREPLTRRFGAAWYQELCDVADALRAQGLL